MIGLLKVTQVMVSGTVSVPVELLEKCEVNYYEAAEVKAVDI